MIADGQQHGLLGKYRVERLEDPTGAHTDCRYFVLDPQHDPLARAALHAYPVAAEKSGYAELADDLYDWLAEVTPVDEDSPVTAFGLEPAAPSRFTDSV